MSSISYTIFPKIALDIKPVLIFCFWEKKTHWASSTTAETQTNKQKQGPAPGLESKDPDFRVIRKQFKGLYVLYYCFCCFIYTGEGFGSCFSTRSEPEFVLFTLICLLEYVYLNVLPGNRLVPTAASQPYWCTNHNGPPSLLLSDTHGGQSSSRRIKTQKKPENQGEHANCAQKSC